MAASFVDTNILVYAHDTSAGRKQERARELLAGLWERGEGCLSVQVLQEFYVTVTQKVAVAMAPAQAAQIVQDLSAWQIHAPGPEDVLRAIELQQRHSLSFWDAMIVQSAVRLGCDILWSEDLNAGQSIEGVQVANPF